MVTRYAIVSSPLGGLVVSGDDRGSISGLAFADSLPPAPEPSWQRDDDAFREVTAQLGAYFARRREEFTIELAPSGTPFQRLVWTALLGIPYGATSTYARLAQMLERPRAVRAVGHANGRNPIAIMIPCHRLVGSDGGLTGYGGGLHRKQWLLQHERSAAPQG